jgi:hypothetical protein
MSKASEFKNKLDAMFMERPVLEFDFFAVKVADSGDLIFFGEQIRISPEEALRLADWIRETFGD